MKPIETNSMLFMHELARELLKQAARGVTVFPCVHDETNLGTNSRNVRIEFEVRIKKFNGMALPASRKPTTE